MTEKPTALRLADCLEGSAKTPWTREEAAAELRRQHTEIEQLREQNTILDAACTKLDMVRDELLEHLEAEKSVCREGVRRIAELTTQRDELLEALREMTERIEGHPAYEAMTEEEENLTGGDTAELSYLARIGRTAITKAEGGAA